MQLVTCDALASVQVPQGNAAVLVRHCRQTQRVVRVRRTAHRAHVVHRAFKEAALCVVRQGDFVHFAHARGVHAAYCPLAADVEDKNFAVCADRDGVRAVSCHLY